MAKSSTSFSEGNTAAVKHGARSPRLRENYRKSLLSEMRQLVDQALGEAHPSDVMLRDLLACALTDVRQIDDWLTRMGGPFSAQGRVYRAAELRRGRERDVLALSDRLGMGPKARAVIAGSIQPEGLASLLARQRLQSAKPLSMPLAAADRPQEAN